MSHARFMLYRRGTNLRWISVCTCGWESQPAWRKAEAKYACAAHVAFRQAVRA